MIDAYMRQCEMKAEGNIQDTVRLADSEEVVDHHQAAQVD